MNQLQRMRAGKTYAGLLGLALCLAWQPAVAAAQADPVVDADGAVHFGPITVPFSTFVSPEGKAVFLDSRPNLKTATDMLRSLSFVNTENIGPFRHGHEAENEAELKKIEAVYPAHSRRTTLGDVPVMVTEPDGPIPLKNAHRVLIQLHGGAFVGGGTDAEVAAGNTPIAGLAKIKVAGVEYRQGPEFKFPAASEDVEAVYRELLKSYSPGSIGIYGCSAGGVLAAEAIAWIQSKGLPRPGAVGTFCGSAAGWSGGDAASYTMQFQGYPMPPEFTAQPHPQISNMVYFSDADMNDPRVLPIKSDAVLAQFPPTLLITSTRDQALSAVIYTDVQLTRLHVKSELHVWEGLPHGFFGALQTPESRQALDVIVRFFDENLSNGKEGH